MKVKVCGITSLEDAMLAVDHGVDALGFNFYPGSSRYIEPEKARWIGRQLPPFVVRVGLFVNVESPDAVDRTARSAGIQVLQLHGDEAPDYCRELVAWPVIKAVRMHPGLDWEAIGRFSVTAYLLDSRDEVAFGGTGRTFDWSLAENVRKLGTIILAGGLSAGNVAEAVRRVRPYGLDVCSGVESSPGKKDAQKLRAFMNEVRNVE